MGTNLQTGNSNMDGKCQERQKHREMGTKRSCLIQPWGSGKTPGRDLEG